jgi:hypothetical protein
MPTTTKLYQETHTITDASSMARFSWQAPGSKTNHKDETNMKASKSIWTKDDQIPKGPPKMFDTSQAASMADTMGGTPDHKSA